MENTPDIRKENILENGMVIEINEYTKPIGTFREPLLDTAYFDVRADQQKFSFTIKKK